MTFKMTRTALVAAAALSALAAGAARANPVFDGSFNATAGAGDAINPQNPYAVITSHGSSSPVTYDLSASSLDPGARPTSILSFANLKVETSMDPLPHVSAYAQTTGEYTGAGSAGLRYDIRAFITGSAVGITEIPLIIEGHWTTSVLGYGSAEAKLGLSGLADDAFDESCIVTQLNPTAATGCGSHDFAYRFSLDTPVFGGAAYTGFVVLAASASTFSALDENIAPVASSQISTVEAFVDPIIYIDPAFLALHPGVTFFPDGTDGITDTPPPGARGLGGAAAVPEPASWALMIAGFGLAGAALRRRRVAFA